MDEAQGLPIEVTPQRVACPGHGEHFRASWPTGFLIFGVKMFQAATESPKLWDACRAAAHLSAVESIPPETINLVTERLPLCYFVPRETIISLLRDAGILRIARCDVCGRSDFAGPYSVSYAGRVAERVLCIGCACDTGERIHRAHPEGGVWHG